MTPGELKFALLVERALNVLPDPEYRQLVVEALMVAGLVASSTSHTGRTFFGDASIVVEHIIDHARRLFLQDQVYMYGAQYCAASSPGFSRNEPGDEVSIIVSMV